jgi:hypothetical protein
MRLFVLLRSSLQEGVRHDGGAGLDPAGRIFWLVLSADSLDEGARSEPE